MRMSHRQWRKLDVVARVERGEFTVSEAAQALGLSRRQVQRLRKKIQSEGHKGVIHGNAGRAPAHKTPSVIRDRIVELARNKYAGFNDQHFTEKLWSIEGLKISRQTVRRVLRLAGIGSPRKRRPPKHRTRRDRRSRGAGHACV
jgi:transposase